MNYIILLVLLAIMFKVVIKILKKIKGTKSKKNKKSKHKKKHSKKSKYPTLKDIDEIETNILRNARSFRLNIRNNIVNKTNTINKKIKAEVRHSVLKPLSDQDLVLKPDAGVVPLASTVNPPYGPAQIRSCYNVGTYSLLAGKPAPIVAVIACYYNPKMQSDFDQWTTNFKLPRKVLNIINLGTTRNLATGSNKGWYLEACLDVQSVYTISPNANIYVIMAKSPSFTDLSNAIARANQIGASVVSMSFGTVNSADGPYLESVFNSRTCCYLASSGDSPTISYPSTSPNTLSIGGTTLQISDLGNSVYTRTSETTWGSAGLGFSTYFTQPTYQNNITLLSGKNRATPDICADANPSTGFSVYCSNYSNTGSGWYQVGGTSFSCPLIAGLVANANILRINANKSRLTTVSASGYQLQNFIYSIYKTPNASYPYNTNFYDVNTGTDGAFTAGTGYDIPTSLGVPNFSVLANSLANGI